jgi:type I restriction enzyme S subunit
MGSGTALVPRLRFSEFRDAGGWEPKRLGRFLSESRLPGSKGDVAKKITVRLWGSGVFAKNEAVQGSANTQYFRRKPGQLIYSKLDFLNQAFGIIPDELDGYESTADLPCFDISADLNPAFILECVKRKSFYLRVGEAADGSRIAKRIHPETFLASEIPLPSLPEQQKIADFLDSADALIAAQGRKVEELRAHKQGLMQQLFPQEGETQPRLRFPEFEGAGQWSEAKLVAACNLQAGKFVAASEIQEHSAEGLFPCYGGNGLRGYTASFTHSGRYPLIGRQGALCGNVKFVVGKFHATEHAVVASPKKRVRVGWLFYLLDHLDLNKFATGQAQPGLSVDVLNNVMTSIPQDEAEQQRIADCLTSLDDLIAVETRKLDTLKTHKRGLMQQLFPQVETATA